jgi:hypothetical protein
LLFTVTGDLLSLANGNLLLMLGGVVATEDLLSTTTGELLSSTTRDLLVATTGDLVAAISGDLLVAAAGFLDVLTVDLVVSLVTGALVAETRYLFLLPTAFVPLLMGNLPSDVLQSNGSRSCKDFISCCELIS